MQSRLFCILSIYWPIVDITEYLCQNVIQKMPKIENLSVKLSNSSQDWIIIELAIAQTAHNYTPFHQLMD